jgi:hypothetical protein
LNIAAGCGTHLRTAGLPISNLGPERFFPIFRCSWFSQVPSGKCLDIPFASFRIFLSLVFGNNIIKVTYSEKPRWSKKDHEIPGADKSLARPTSLSIFFSVQGKGSSPMGPDPENRVGDQDIGSSGRSVSSGLQVPSEPFPSWSG